MGKLEFKLTKYRLIMMAIIALTTISIHIFKIKIGYVNYIMAVLFVAVGILTYLDNKEESKK